MSAAHFPCTTARVDTQREYRRQLREFAPTVILSDHGAKTFDTLTALAIAQRKAPNVPFILITHTLAAEMPMRALQRGPADLILKIQLSRLPSAIHKAIQQAPFTADRHKTEDALHSSEENYRQLAELCPEALFVVSDGRILQANTSALRLFGGRTASDLRGRSFTEFVHPGSVAEIDQQLYSTILGGTPSGLRKHQMLSLTGKELNVEVAAAPLIHDDR